MKLAYVSCLYEGAITACYRRNEGLADRDYGVQLAAFFREGLHWNGAWEGSLEPLGYEVTGILNNVDHLQRAWAREQGHSVPRKDGRNHVTLWQLKAINPTVLLLDGGRFSAAWLNEVRLACPALRLVFTLLGSPSYDLGLLRGSDLVLSCSKELVGKVRQAGCRSRHFPHAFNLDILPHLAFREPVREAVLFAGGLVRGQSFHSAREQLIEHLSRHVPLILYSEKATLSRGRDAIETLARRGVFCAHRLLAAAGLPESVRWRLPVIGRATAWDQCPVFQFNKILRPLMNPALFGREMLSATRQCAVALNAHGGIAGGYASNIRLFEATGVGACLLTDRSLDLADFFEPDTEVVAYDNQDDCAEKAQWLLDHPLEREEIARRGHGRTVRDHTYANRALQLHTMIQELLHGA